MGSFSHKLSRSLRQLWPSSRKLGKSDLVKWLKAADQEIVAVPGYCYTVASWLELHNGDLVGSKLQHGFARQGSSLYHVLVDFDDLRPLPEQFSGIVGFYGRQPKQIPDAVITALLASNDWDSVLAGFGIDPRTIDDLDIIRNIRPGITNIKTNGQAGVDGMAGEVIVNVAAKMVLIAGPHNDYDISALVGRA